MKGMMKILLRYVMSAVMIALILLIVNFVIFAMWTIKSSKGTITEYNISEISDSLIKQKGDFILSETGEDAIKERYQWAMLLDDGGTVIWSDDLPDDVPKSFTVSQVASFTRWYLNDYPVHVWRHTDGLLVLGSPKGSAWKLGMEMPEKVMANFPTWFFGGIILNCLTAVLLALLFGTHMSRSLRPIAKGIEDLAEKKPVELAESGILGDLAAGLNKASAQLKLQELKLQKRDNARTTWIAGVSHDIRTPLSMVMGYASQLEDNKYLTEEEREQAGIILRQSEKIKALISDLNLASKLEYEMQPLRLSEVNVAALLRAVVADFLNGGLGEGYDIDLNIKNDVNSILTGDRELLRRAVINLITNSIQHNSQGCNITLALKKEADYYVISIYDNGGGLSDEVLRSLKIWDIPEKLQNHGLGLMIVRQIVKVHGGTVEFGNLIEGGCRTMIRLPINSELIKGY